MSLIPKKVKVGSHFYDIESWHPLNAQGANRFGECSSVEKIIRVDFSQKPDTVRDTVLHECLHALWVHWNIQDNDGEERTVDTLATALTTLMVDNPELREYFFNQWKEPDINGK